MRKIAVFFSLFVVLGVFWGLKLTGITLAGEAFCGTEEHRHGENCPSGRLVCPLEETPGHVHDESCILRQTVCGQEEVPPHTHDGSCRYRELICTEEEREGHTHDQSCLGRTPVCTEEESETHSHTEDCYSPEEAFLCGEEEDGGHTHGEECYLLHPDTFVCGLEEVEGHLHREECFSIGTGFGCGLSEAEGHSHTEECLTDETDLGCGQTSAPPHTHTENCYEKLEACPLEEHIHTESCYSDLNADVEIEEDWESIRLDIPKELSTAELVAAVARSQLGYEESARNFEVDRLGIRRGITRYGQWYGNPYGDWSAMFASFCLHYAGVEDLPANAGPESMRLEWIQAGLYQSADVCLPRAGNLIFLRTDLTAELPVITSPGIEVPEIGLPTVELSSTQTPETETEPEGMESPAAPPFALRNTDAASAVAIITEVSEEEITVIQGDVNGMVVQRTLAAEDPTILGYGLIPERSPFAVTAAVSDDPTYVARTTNYSSSIFTGGRSFLLYTQRDGVYYAIDGNANAVPVEIGPDGSIYANADPNTLLWTFTRSNSRYVIANVDSGLYLHPHYNSDYDKGILHTTGWDTPVIQSGTGVQFIHSASACLNDDATAFDITRDQNQASVFYFGVAEHCTIWLDGTNGGLMSLGGSTLESRSVVLGSAVTLPSEWKSPEKYSYTLRGWYDIKNRRYYAAGEEVTVTEELLFYADWAAETYDIGQMNEDVVDTVSTSEFITTRVFDYNSLFNVLSMNHNYSGGNSARWTLVEDGPVQTTGEDTLNFVFIDYDNVNNPGAISYPIGRNQAQGVDYSRVTFGLYDEKLVDLLYNTEVPVAGKHYLGLGDHLFQYGADPADTEHYGYYYYDSMLNAASYHQSNGRFYVYDYLERTADSANNGSYSDFLPLNSIYANTNGKSPGTYTYNGVHNEHIGTQHYSYDSKYSDADNSTNRIGTNYWFGMAMDLEFFLPAVPGTKDSEGVWANQSITGEDMIFEFSGDDDVWVLIDGELVLDIGGIHGVESGSIDFSTGDVIVDGVKTGNVNHLSSGSHTLTMYYLERGSSMSNFMLRFNLSTRYSMTLRKEDTLTAHLLNGAQFSVYTNEACTHPAELWVDRDAYERGDPPTNLFEVTDGVASLWGFAAGNTYYIEETRGPDKLGGLTSNGIIRMRLNNRGLPDYEVLPNHSGDLTVGYTVHGFKVNEDTQEAFLVVSNTDATESEPTQVYVEKVWSDSVDHSGDPVTVYLLANGIRVQSVILNEDNDWHHTWVNLPKTDSKGNEVVYTVREATVPGYVGEVTVIDPPSSGGGGSSGSGSGTLTPDGSFQNGETYLLQTQYGYIGASGNRVLLESSADTARNAPETQWVASVHSNDTVTLTNNVGQTLYYDNYTFKASSSPGTYRNLNFSDGKLFCFIDHGGWSETLYPIANDNVANNVLYNGVFYTTGNSVEAMTITLQRLGGAIQPEPPPEGEDPGDAFRITNVPAGEATLSLTVRKQWDTGGLGQDILFEDLTVLIALMANGEDAGLVGTLNLRNGWTYTFDGLPKYDSRGSPIEYTVEEIDLPSEWRAEYGPVVGIGNSQTAYETTVTNVYRMTVELPTTGGIGHYGYTVLGALILLSSLCWYCGQRRKSERRRC